MSISCSICLWSPKKIKKPVFLANFSSQPTHSDIQKLADVIQQLKEYKEESGERFFGVFDLQGNLPADPIHVILQAKTLVGYSTVLENVILINVHPGSATTELFQQINLFAKYQVYIVKAGSTKQQAKDIEVISKTNKEVAAFVASYLRDPQTLHLIKKL